MSLSFCCTCIEIIVGNDKAEALVRLEQFILNNMKQSRHGCKINSILLLTMTAIHKAQS